MKSRLRPLPVVLVLLGLLLPSAAAEDAKPKPPRWKKGEQEGKVEIDGKPEGFVALVPKGYTTKKKWPVVLLAHGNGGTAANFLQAVKPFLGKKPPLIVSLERCDNKQQAEGYVPKYRAALADQFSLDESLVFALGFSGGGFRLWDDVVAKKDEVGRYRGVVLVGSARQNFAPADKPDPAPTIVLVGDPTNDPNFRDPGAKAREELTAKGYEVVVHEHGAGHSLPAAEMKKVFAWIDETIKDASKKRPAK